jgi:transposase
MLFAGIDWSERFLDFHLRTADGKVLAEGQVRPDVEGMARLFVELESHAPASEIGVAVETAHGAWVQALLDRGYQVYPLNPKTVERFREALSASGAKTDKIDRKVLAMFLVTFHLENKPLRPDVPEMVQLRLLCQDRLRLVEERSAKVNELAAVLKCYYPAFSGFFGGLDSDIALDFLKQYPTQRQMQRLTEPRLRNWLRRHRYCFVSRIDGMVSQLKQPVLPVAEHLQEAKKTLICYLAGSLKMLNREIAQRDQQINQHLDRLPESDWVRSLPGAGKVLAPSLLACLGRDPQRFASVGEARALMGTAPVTKASGKFRAVVFRRGCWKFARRTLQLFAEQSRHQCSWAQTFYEKQRSCGHKHHAALRALAHRWLKILLAMKRSGELYDEEIFLHSQRRYLLHNPTLHTSTQVLFRPTP